MHIGITYDLRSDYLKMGFSEEETAEFDKESTIDAIEQAIRNEGHTTDKVGNVFSLIQMLNQGKRWDLVFNIAEGLYGDGRESLVPALLDAFKIPYVFSGPVTLGITLNKLFAKKIVRDSGINTAPFQVIYSEADLKNINLEYPLFVKPVSEGTGKGITSKSIITSSHQLEERSIELLNKYNQPVLVEEFLPGREFTVGIIGSGSKAKALGAMEILFKNNIDTIYSYHTKENYTELVEYIPLTDQYLGPCVDTAIAAWNALNCLDAGRVDLRVDQNGNVCFIEVNPLAGLNPVSSDLPILCGLHNISYQELIGQILLSAIERITHGK